MRSWRNNPGNPLERGNALRKKNLGKILLRYMFIALLLVAFYAAIAHLLAGA